MTENPDHIKRIKQALIEVRANRDVFSAEVYGLMVMVLLDRLRQAQTRRPVEPVATDRTPTDEIRLVTVMFVDIHESTWLSQHMEAGDWKRLIDNAHQRVSEVVSRWDGQIGQYLGDGVLCFFGAQHSKGDDAIRCVSCALEIQQTIDRYANDVFLAHGVELAVRVGVSTGRVVVGIVGHDMRQELLALGPATNLAARLQTIASPGEILTDTTTYNRIRQHFILTPRSPVYLKGFDEPVMHYAVVARDTRASARFTPDGVRGIRLPFIGRDDEMATIKDVLKKAIEQQQFYTVTITGEMGTGKSRLLQEAPAQVNDVSLTTLPMIAYFETRNVRHNLLRNLIMSLCNLSENITPAVARRHITAYITHTRDYPDAMALVDALVRLTGFDDSSVIAPDSHNETVAFDLIVAWLRAIAAEDGLLLLIDDLQWADAASLRLLDYLMHQLTDVPGAMIVTVRLAFLNDNPQYLGRRLRHRLIMLDKLPQDATRDLVTAFLKKIERVPPMLPETLVERSGGNPYFIQELLGMLFDNEVVQVQEDGTWRFNMLQYDQLASLPDGLLGVFQNRIDDLSAGAREVVQIAAIIGRTFWSGAVASLTDLTVEPLLALLLERGLITRSLESDFEDEVQYTFRHTLYRDVACEMLPRTRREPYHLQVADWLMARVDASPAYYDQLIYHLEAGGEHDRALITCLRSVRLHMDAGRLTVALDQIDRGLSLARNVSRQTALPVVSQFWTIRSQILTAMDRYEEASAAAQSALMLLSELPGKQLTDMRLTASRMLGLSYMRLGRYTDARAAFNRAYEYLRPDDDAGRAAVLYAFGVLSLYQGQLAESLSYQERAHQHAQQSGDLSRQTGPMIQLGVLARERGQPVQALQYFEKVLEINRERGYRRYQASDLLQIGIVYLSLLCYERARIVFERALAIHEEQGTQDVLLMAYYGLCLVYLDDTAEGIRWLHQATATEQQNVNMKAQVELCLLAGLLHSGDTVRCHELAMAFVASTQDRNPILHGRGLRYAGIAGQALGIQDAAAYLNQALDQEREFAGGELWQVYLALADITEVDHLREAYREQASGILRQLGESLTDRPELQQVFLNSQIIRDLPDTTTP